jgi:hypothetical protein
MVVILQLICINRKFNVPADNKKEPFNNKKEPVDSKCSRILMLLPQMFYDHGHGSQINSYLMGAITATFLDRAFLVLDADSLARGQYLGGSPFGCPADAFEGKVTAENFSSDLVKKDFPMGFSRLVDHPQWLSRGCPIPCRDTHSYKDWVRISRDPENQVTCTNPDGSTVDVVVFDGSRLRELTSGERFMKLMGYHDYTRESIDRAQRWALNMGATSIEAEYFASMKVGWPKLPDPNPIWDFVLALGNKAGFLTLQPWIERDMKSYLASFDLPRNKDYAAIHVRRGDKVGTEARDEIVKYWKNKGYNETDMPSNYIPFSEYLDKWDGPDVCPKNKAGKVQVMKHHVYVATDDPTVVRQEIENLPNHVNGNPYIILWHTCHEIKFHFSPAISEPTFHINGGAGDTCFDRYHRNILSMVDMMIILKAKTIIVEYNSNWGRLIRNLRVRLNDDVISSGSMMNMNVDESFRWESEFLKSPLSATYSLDTRIAWGDLGPGIPGD